MSEEDDTLVGTTLLARRALATPIPPAQAEIASRERVLAQLREAEPPPRPLHGVSRGPDSSDTGMRLLRVLRRLWKR